jgi:hypothetical protein
MPASNFFISSCDNCGRSMLIVSLLNFAVSGNGGVMYQYAIDDKSANYKAPFNQIYNEAHTFTPADTGVVTPNADTPYSFTWMDLRAEPIVICVPKIEKDRYFSVMLTSLYTYNFGYLGSRTTGNGGGCYAVAGPDWAADTPKGIDKVITLGSKFAFAVFRTQLFNPEDIDNVRAIQAQYKVEPLSTFLGEQAPRAAPAIDWLVSSRSFRRTSPSIDS